MSKFPLITLLLCAALSKAADLPGSKDPAGMKRYEGSQIIGYHSPKFDEYLLPLGAPTQQDPPKYTKSLPVEGLVTRATYVAPAGRSATELLRNYKLEFQRLGLQTLYEKKADDPGWFGPTLGKIEDEDGLKQVLTYNQADERMLVGQSHEAKPTYYMVFVTSYRDGLMPEAYKSAIQKGSALALVVVVAPEALEQRMTLLTADAMKTAIERTGRATLYGIHFDTGKDVVKAESQPAINEIVKLLKNDPALHLHVVGHTDNQGKVDANLDLSRRRAASVVHAIAAQGISADRLDAFGCGVYAPVDSNETEEGRAKNRRVELTRW